MESEKYKFTCLTNYMANSSTVRFPLLASQSAVSAATYWRHPVNRTHMTKTRTDDDKILELTMTRLTREMALRVIFHRYIMPSMLVKIMPIVTVMITADQRSNPSRMKVMMKMAAALRLKLTTESWTMVRYCS